MKMPTVSLLVCIMMALIQAFFVPGYHQQYIPENDTQPGETTGLPEEPDSTDGDMYMWRMPPWLDDLFGGWFPRCPEGWSFRSQQCLLFVPANLTWEEANKNCRSLGGQLTSVRHEGQAGEMQAMTRNAGYDHGQFWVGGYNTPEDPNWSWSEQVYGSVFYDFCDEEEQEHCLEITFDEGGKGCLDDMKCEAELPSICSYIK